MSLNPALGPNLEPAQKRMALHTNYLSFTDGDNDFAQQYLPELYEQEVERYGNRTIAGFLRMVGAEMPMTSDQVVWSEQNRLHVAYETCEVIDGTTIRVNIDPDVTAAGGAVGSKECAVKVNNTLVVYGNGTTGAGQGKTMKVLVTAAPSNYQGGGAGVPRTCDLTVACYEAAKLTTGGQNPGEFDGSGSSGGLNSDVAIFVYGSEWEKGSNTDALASIEPDFTQFSNSPIIIRDKFEINGSDTAQIGWVEVATEDGTSGYLWYLKSESETRLRFEDYMEMAMVEGELAIAGGGVAALGLNNASQAGQKGTQGLFAAIKDRGHEYQNFAGTGGGNDALDDFDSILAQLDFEGAIEENMIFCNRSLALSIDNMIANVNGSAQASGAGNGASYGLFENDANMALNFGFDGFRRGSYDFYKTDWKYLNDASTRGLAKDIEGVLVPAGTSTVYDQMLGSNIRRPFLHVRYRASEADDRRLKSWVTGSVGGAYTSSLDAMEVHFLSERCLVTQAANNFMLFTT